MAWDLRLVRALVTVADTQHLGRAAVALHLSQPALTKQIRQLEQSWNVTLFDRHARGVTPTRAAERLLPGARELLAQAQLLQQLIDRAHQGENGVLRLGFIGQALNEYTPIVLRAFNEAYPAGAVELRQYDMHDLSAGLLARESDVAILRLPLTMPGLVHHEFLTEPRVAVLPEGHQLLRHQTLLLEQLLDLPWVRSVSPDPVYQDFARASAARHGRGPVPGPLVASIDEYLEAVLAGTGIGLAPASAARYYSRPGVAYRIVADAEPSTVSVSHLGPPHRLTALAAGFLDIALRHRPSTG